MGYHHKGAPKGQRNKSALTSFRLRPSILKVTPQPCCFHCEQNHSISNCRLQEEEGVFKSFGGSKSKKGKGLYFKYRFITCFFLQLTRDSIDHTFTFSSNDPYTIKTYLKDVNRNFLQISEKALLDNILKQAKKVLMLGLPFILKDKHPPSTQKPLRKSGLFVTKN
jgi:hypothetical protein